MLTTSTHIKRATEDELWLKNKNFTIDMRTPFVKSPMKTLWIKWRIVLCIGVSCLLLLFLYHDKISTIMFDYENSCIPPTKHHPYINPIYSYCNSIDSDPVPSDEGKVSDEEYKLEMVHAIVRHGDRNLLHNLSNYKAPQISCDLRNHMPTDRLSIVKDFLVNMDKNAKLKLRNSLFNYNLYPNQSVCDPGDLTPEGVVQHIRNGLNFKKVYADKWKLYKGQMEKEIILYSTNKKRTFQSAIALISGFIPDLDISLLNIEVADNSDMCIDSHISFPCECPLISQFRETQSHNIQQNHLEFFYNEGVSSALKSISKAMNIDIKKLPAPSHLMDIGMVHTCHHKSLPGSVDGSVCWNPKALHDIAKALNSNSLKHSNKKKTKIISTLRILPLLNSLLLQMESKEKKLLDTNFVLYAGHDATFDPLLIALNISDSIWPKYASRLVFELYRKVTVDSNLLDYYLRIIYNGVDVTENVIFCKGDEGKPLKMCPLNLFKKFIRTEDGLSGFDLKSYISACKQSIYSL